MSSDLDQQSGSSHITFYFNKASNVFDSFVDKHTRGAQNKKFVESEYVFRFKASTQLKFS